MLKDLFTTDASHDAILRSIASNAAVGSGDAQIAYALLGVVAALEQMTETLALSSGTRVSGNAPDPG